MARKNRFTFENAVYHVMTRGNNKQNIFFDDHDFYFYKDILKLYAIEYDASIHNYVLMHNHVHKIVRTKKGDDLSSMMKKINMKYAAYFRKKYGGIGHFWQDRFKSFVIQEGRYLLECGIYIELNPISAKIINFPWKYKWSSCKFYMLREKDNLIEPNPEYIALSENSERRVSIYKELLLNNIANKENRREERFFRTGAYGSKEFIEKLKFCGLKSSWSHSGRPGKKKK